MKNRKKGVVCQTLDRQHWTRQTLDKQTMDITNTRHNKHWTLQTADMTNATADITNSEHNKQRT